MVALDAEKVLSVPRKIHAVEVVRRGFMSNFLFQNIGNIFSAPRQVADILGQLPTVKEQKPSKAKEGGQEEGGLLDGAADLPLNEKGEVVLPLDELTRKTGELFGDKIYSDNVVTQTKIDEVSTSNAPDKKAAQNLVTILVDTVVNPTLQDAKTHYGDEMSRASEHRLKSSCRIRRRSRSARQRRRTRRIATRRRRQRKGLSTRRMPRGRVRPRFRRFRIVLMPSRGRMSVGIERS